MAAFSVPLTGKRICSGASLEKRSADGLLRKLLVNQQFKNSPLAERLRGAW